MPLQFASSFLTSIVRASCVLLICLAVFVGHLHAEDKKADAAKKEDSKKKEEKITFDEHILPIFRQRCGSCHNGNDQKGGLTLDNYSAMMSGGGSGDVYEPGDPDSSYLYMVVNHDSEPYMPPNQPKMPEKELALIKRWIELGVPENAGSKGVVKKKSNDLARVEITTGRPPGEPVLPVNFPVEPVIHSAQANTVTALATSPWASLVAVSGHKQVLLYDTKTMQLTGVLPFDEGTPHALKFSRNGKLLISGGGRGGASGRVVIWDVKTGKRIAEVGAEYDQVLAADISPDQTQIVLGGPKKMVRVFDARTGELMYENKKHTDWVTSAEFSPDGVLLATGDRSNGLVIWEALTGREFHFLKGHKGAIYGMSWRLDSNVLATCSEDGTAKLWEMNDGNNIKSWNAHSGGATSIAYSRDGRLLTTGRDKRARLWAGDGKKLRDFPALPDLGLEVAFDSENDIALVGDWTGTVYAWSAKDGKELAKLTTNPLPVQKRIENLQAEINAKKNIANQAKAKVDQINKQVADRKVKVDQAAAAVDAMTKKIAATDAAIKTLPPEWEKAKTAFDTLLKNNQLDDAAKKQITAAKTDAETKYKAKVDGMTKSLKASQGELAKLKQSHAALVKTAPMTADEKKALDTSNKAAGDALAEAKSLEAAIQSLKSRPKQLATAK